ncbi:MAG TPA: glycosyltransferase family 4 protein [Solirubrobacteraceae bacterium]|jgi:phosphatidylinositol alpha-1,6-mannosyltransferase
MSDGGRVLVITPDFPPAKGGIQVLIHRIVSSFTTLEPTVVTLGHAESREFDRRQNFRVLRVPTRHGPRTLAILALIAKSIALALDEHPNIVLNGHIVTGPAAAFIRKQRGIPFAQYVYAKELGARPDLARFVLTRANRIIAISRYAKELAETVGAPAGRIALIRPGVDLGAFVNRPATRTTRPTIITVARLEDRYKGHDVLLRALPLVRAQIPDTVWHVVGDGPLRRTLEDRVGALGLDGAVQFLGALNDDERDRELDSADVFCMVSRLPAGGFAGEGFGIVYLEANAHGLPVVAGAAGGATDAVVDGVTGLLVDPEDHLAVADALVGLLRDRKAAEQMGQAGREHAERFSWTAAGQSVEAELLRLLA